MSSKEEFGGEFEKPCELRFCIQSFVISYSCCTERYSKKFSMYAVYFNFRLWVLYMLKFSDASVFYVC
jgi:hypothetical protein